MLPVRKSRNYSRSYEFRQIICPLNKHSQNKQHFGKIFKIQVFEVDINKTVLLVIVMLKLKTFNGK